MTMVTLKKKENNLLALVTAKRFLRGKWQTHEVEQTAKKEMIKPPLPVVYSFA